MPRNLYFGIDLGTTNSVAAWGQVNKDGKFITKIAELDVLDARKNRARKTLLPSCVYFSSKGEPPIVGDYAKNMFSTQSRRVVKSVKSSMGTGNTYTIDEQEHNPAEISSFILKQIAAAAKRITLGDVLDDVVVTVPASFDPDQREATNEAARQAGFRITEDDGSPRNILLNEPTAALYDFLNRQDNGEIPELVDLSAPKVILVFDLGGGTLDVSLHSVSKTPAGITGTLPYNITPYAISRHTLLGGDNFDELLQKFFMSMMKGVDFGTLDEFKADLFRSEFLDAAEQAKIELNAEVESYRMQGEDYGNLAYDVWMNYIAHTDLTFEYTLTVEKYREIMAPYLAPDLTMASVENIDALADRTDNIIYPILDVLNKAKLKLGSVPKIDAVLLNGGMSKLFAVRERIEQFFGFPPLEVGDPDLAVARGASVYHYWRHLGVKTPEIQNDDIGIELQGGTVHKLIFAGENLPFQSAKFQFSIPEDGIMWIDLPFYKGTRPDIMPPNKRIATRRIRFNTPYAADTLIELQAVVNEIGTLSLKVWDPKNPELFYPVDNIHPDVAEPYVEPAYVVPAGGFTTKPPAAIMQTGQTENIPALMDKYVKTGQAFASNRNPMNNGTYTAELKALESRIESASNSGEAVNTMGGLMTSYAYIADRAARMLGRLARVSEPKYAAKARAALEDFCKTDRIKYTVRVEASRRKLHVKSMAIQALSMLRNPEHEKFFLSTLKLKPFPVESVLRELCYALGRTGYSSEAVYAVADCINSPKIGEKIPAYWALGRISRRERPDKCPASCLEDVLPSVFRFLRNEYHPDILRNGVYAIGEMCDQRIPGEKVSDTFVSRAEDFLMDLSDRLEGRQIQAQGFIKIALNMIHSAELSVEQKFNLLKLRDEVKEEN